MLRFLIAALMAATPLSGAWAQNMNAETFHKRAQALKKKGAMAIFARGEIKKLTSEAQAAAKKAREQRLATLSAGGKPRSCPPEGSRMNSDEFMSRLAAIPPAERARIDMTEATIRILATKYPC